MSASEEWVDAAVASVDGVVSVYESRSGALRSLLPPFGSHGLSAVSDDDQPVIRVSIGLGHRSSPTEVSRAVAEAARQAAGLPGAVVRVRIARIEGVPLVTGDV